MTSVILVGLRADGGHRDRLWAYARERWQREPGWPIFEGEHEEHEGPFCLSVASNRASALAGDWKSAFYVGADWTLLDCAQAEQAVELAARRRQLVFAHDRAIILSEGATKLVLEGHAVLGDYDAALSAVVPGLLHETEDGTTIHGHTFSGAFAVPRKLWDAVGGFDERFIGWGGDDLGFWSACCGLGRGFARIPGAVMRLWHPRSRADNEDQPPHAENEALMRRYLDAKASRVQMVALLREPGAPNGGRKSL